MKKAFFPPLFLFVFVLFYSCGKNTNESNVYSKLNIQYKKVWECRYKFGQPDTADKYIVSIIEFNRSGKSIKSMYFENRYNWPEWNRIRIDKYDSIGNCTSSFLTNFKGKIVTYSKYVNNLITESTFYSEDNMVKGKNIYKYDKRGNLIEEVGYDSIGKVDWKEISKYDSKSFCIEVKRYNSKGERTTYTKLISKVGNKSVFNDIDDKNEVSSIFASYCLKENLDTLTTYQSMKDNYKSMSRSRYNENELMIDRISYDKNNEPEFYQWTEFIKFK